MASIIVIGSGILGLSVAEYLSRTEKNVTILSNDHPMSGSFAAAANLATKGQLYGRDPHFQMKIDAKNKYRGWITSLLEEAQENIELERIFRQGAGIDSFFSKEDRDHHLQRVLQPQEELLERKLPVDFIKSEDDNKVIYQDEAWVDAAFLLRILKNVLLKRGVIFISETFSQKSLERYKNKECVNLIFCTGAWTKDLLSSLSFPIPNRMQRQARFTIGSTFFGNKILESDQENFVLQEIISFGRKNKVTFSGNENLQYVSSSTLKFSSEKFPYFENEIENINDKNIELLKLAKLKIKKSCYLKEDCELNKLTGIRVGYGHSEIVLEKFIHHNFNTVICSGAHKSGFLFASEVGGRISAMLFKQKKFDSNHV